MDNVTVRTDPAGNIKADKEKSTEKIDGAVATIMALDRAIRCGKGGTNSVYDERDNCAIVTSGELNMNLSEVNTQLYELYASNLENLKTIYDRASGCGIVDYANPLLLSCHEGYLEAKKKIIYIGQETCSWYSDPRNQVLTSDDIKMLQSGYLNFMLPQTYVSPFWLFIYEVSRTVSEGCNYMWSNICKIGKRHDAGRADHRINELETCYFNIGKKEIGILDPDLIVFLSGPNYDQDIKSHFGNFRIVQNYDDCFDQLSIDGMRCKAFRLYHPNYHNYLGREKKQKYKEKLIQLINQ